MVAALAALALALVRLRPADAPTRRSEHAVVWRSGDVARFTLGELLANAAWAGVLTYSGALLLDSYALSTAVVGSGSARARSRWCPAPSPAAAARGRRRRRG